MEGSTFKGAFIELVIFAVLVSLMLGAFVWQMCCRDQAAWEAELKQTVQYDQTRFRKIQRKHGAVAVATDWSHCVRLNGEVFKLRKPER